MSDNILITSPAAIHQNAVDHGWWEDSREIPELLCLIHSEVSEALEAYRRQIPEGQKGCLSEELADVIIRIFDLCGRHKIDIAEAVRAKHEFNKLRSYRHGNKVC